MQQKCYGITPCKNKKYVATRQKQHLRPLNPNLNLKADHTEHVHKHRHLGVIIDDEFNWQSHITYVKKTVSPPPPKKKKKKKKYFIILLLSQLKHLMDTFKRKLVYHAHISSHLTYASTVWDGCSYILLQKLHSFHSRAAKLMLPDSSTTTEATIQRLERNLCSEKALLVFKACRNHAPQYPASLFVCSNSRSSRSIILPKPRIDLFKTSFSFSGASIWNSISAQIKACSSLTCVKRQLHKMLRR